jgi:hypothetical protein
MATDSTGQPVDFSKTTQGGISSAMEPYVTDLFENASALARNPYQQYGAEQAAQAQQTTPYRVAGLSGLEQQALGGIGSLQAYNPTQFNTSFNPSQFNASYDQTQFSNTYNPTQFSNTYNPTQFNASYNPSQFTQQSWNDPNRMQQYMSPYQQGVTDIAMREARRQSDIDAQKEAAGAVGVGAFGGSRYGLVEAERQRNTAQLLNDIQTKGLQSAYGAGMGQFNTENALGFQTQQAQNQANLAGGQFNFQQQQAQNQANLAGSQLGLQAQQAQNQANLAGGQLGLQTQQAQNQANQAAGQFDFQQQYAQNQANLAANQAAFQQQYAQNQANLQGYQSGLGILGTQLQAGALPRTLDQAGLDAAYKEFLMQQQKPYENLNFQKGIMSALPPAAYSAVTESQNYEPVNPLAASANIFGQLGGLDFLKNALK